MSGFINATKLGLNTADMVGLNPWQDHGRTPSVEQCGTLLDALVGLNTLNAATGDWLKGRAARLNG